MLLSEMTWPDVAALSRDIPVVLPVAALEQHGRHLPLITDSLLLGEVVRRVAATVGDRVLFAPLQWLGNSDHHLDFPGTLSAPPRVYLDLLSGVLENLIGHGFRRLVMLNGHGGNSVPIQQVVFEVRQRHRGRDDLLLLGATYWGLGARPRAVDPQFRQERMEHACEWETSMMLRLDPPPGPRTGGDRADFARQRLRACVPGLDHARPQCPGPHRRSRRGDRREGGNPLQPVRL